MVVAAPPKPGSPVVVVPVFAVVLELGILPIGVSEEFNRTPFTM